MSGMTIKDIAAAAGVAPITVSRVINNKPDVAESTSERVREIIRQHHWRPNVQARGLVQSRTYTLGFIDNSITSSFTPSLLEAIEEITASHDYGLLIMSARNKSVETFDTMLQRGVDGIILAAQLQLKPVQIEEARQRGIGVVSLYFSREDVATLAVDYVEVGRLAAQHLYNLGHRRCLYIHEPRPLTEDEFALARWQGFVSYSDDLQVQAVSQSSKETEVLKTLLGEGDITAVFCQHDRFLASVFRAAWETGMSIPKDLSVVGSNDQEIARYLTPQATSIDVAKKRIGQQAALRLITAAQGGILRGSVFKPELVVRESTGPAAGATADMLSQCPG